MTTKRESRAERDERIVREAGPWLTVRATFREPHTSPGGGLVVEQALVVVPFAFGGGHSMQDATEAAARILNRLTSRKARRAGRVEKAK